MYERMYFVEKVAYLGYFILCKISSEKLYSKEKEKGFGVLLPKKRAGPFLGDLLLPKDKRKDWCLFRRPATA